MEQIMNYVKPPLFTGQKLEYANLSDGRNSVCEKEDTDHGHTQNGYAGTQQKHHMHKLLFQIFHDSHFLSVAGRRNYIISGMLYIETGPQCYSVTGYILPQRCLPAALLPVFSFQ